MPQITLLLIAFILSLLLQGCYDIDDNRRVLVTGNLVDENGTPITGVNVESRGGGTVLGFSTSDETGDFSFTSIVLS